MLAPITVKLLRPIFGKRRESCYHLVPTDINRKHMVSLRGSKFGSRVGMLCCNPAYTTHPGPGVGMGLSNRFSSAPTLPRYGSNFR